jgi:DNA mismatch endonuclease (patch repair protein)
MSNRDYWQPKLDRNAERDRETDALFRAAGWLVIRVWEHEEPAIAARRVARSVRDRTRRMALRRSSPRGGWDRATP